MAPGAEVVDLTEDAVVDLVSDDEAIATPPAKRRRVAAPGHGAGAEPALSSSAGGSGWGELASTQGDQDVGALQALHGRGGLRLLQHMVAAGGGGGDPQVLALQTAQLQECIGLLRRRLESTMGERFEPQRITRDQLQAALLRARPPRDPPLADPASQGHFTLLCYNLW